MHKIKQMALDLQVQPRPLYTIARDIHKHWTKPYFGAVPYIRAMYELSTLNGMYGADDARSIVAYFLSNAATWRGADARRVKKELSDMLAVHAKERKYRRV